MQNLTTRTCLYPTTNVVLLHMWLTAVTSGANMLNGMVTLSHCGRLSSGTVEPKDVGHGLLRRLSLHRYLMLYIEEVLLLLLLLWLLHLLLVRIHMIV